MKEKNLVLLKLDEVINFQKDNFMKKKIAAAVLGSTGYVGLELINILSEHPNVEIKFLGSASNFNKNINFFDKRIKNKKLPKLDTFDNMDFTNLDVIF